MENCSLTVNCIFLLQVIIKDKVLELLLYFTKHEDEEVKTKAIIGLGKHTIFLHCFDFNFHIFYGLGLCYVA